jgi:transcriptional antiterminator NusG
MEMHSEEVGAALELAEAQPEAEEEIESSQAAPGVADEEVSEVVEAAAILPAEAEAEGEEESEGDEAVEEPQALDAGVEDVEPEEDEAAEEAQPVEAPEAAAVVAAEAEAEGEEASEEDEAAEEPQALEAEIEVPADGRAWYVIHCYSGYEAKVKHNLEQRIETMQMQDQIFQVVVPTEDEIEVRDGKRRTVERRVFPGYILVQMLLNDDSWYVVRNTPGVTGFVGMGNEPTPLRPEEVQSIMKRMEAEAPKIKVTFKQGQKVRIIDGPFNEFIGVVEEIDMERAKVRVLVSFFGRETPVELDFLQVEKT